MGKGALLAKNGCKECIQNNPRSPAADRHLLGVAWEKQLYVDATLPFGLRSATKIFNALEWILKRQEVSKVCRRPLGHHGMPCQFGDHAETL